MYNLVTWLVVIVAALAMLFVLNSPDFAGMPTITAEHANPVIAPR